MDSQAGGNPTLPELAEDIERLVRLAYPDAAESVVEVLAKDQFVDSLLEEDMRLRIRQHRLATLRAALETALELESYQLANKQKARFVRDTVGEGAACAVCDYSQENCGSWGCSSAAGGGSGTMLQDSYTLCGQEGENTNWPEYPSVVQADWS